MIVVNSGTFLNRYLKVSALNGLTGVFPDIPFFLHTAATKTFQAVEGRVLAHALVPYNVSGTWAALNTFALAAKHVGAHPTTADIYAGLYSLSGTTLGGFVPTVTYTKGKPASVNCLFIISIKKGKWVAPRGTKQSCKPATPTS